MANTKVTGDLLADGTLFARHLNESHGITTSVIGEGTNLYYTNDRVSSYLSSNGYATSTAIIASIVDSAPSTLDTLNELAAALGDDPNFATTVTTAIATKVDGTGTANYLMKWSDSNTATNSVVYDNGTNIGLGVTPSAWGSNFKAFQVGAVTALWDVSGVAGFSNNLYNDGTSRYITSNFATIFQHWNGGFAWLQAPSGTAGNAISFTQAMTLNASGNLSIGNTNDTYKLDVSGTGRFTDTVINTVAGHTSVGLYLSTYQPSGISWFDTDDVEQYSIGIVANSGAGYWGLWSSTSGTAIDRSATTPKLAVKNNGYVGIGTNNPTRKLDVNGTSIFRDFTTVVSSNGNSVSNITWLSTDSGLMNLYTGGSATVQLNSNGNSYFNGGNVGIGTTSPNNKLTVAAVDPNAVSVYRDLDVNVVGAAGTYINMGAKDGASFKNGARLVGALFNSTTGAFYLDTLRSGTLTTAVTVLGSGNVGIGTDNPTQLLHLYKSSGSLAISLQSGSNYAYLFNDATNIGLGSNIGVTGVKLLVDRNAPDNSFIINSSGYAGIGTTSPGYKLDVRGYIVSDANSNGSESGFYLGNSAHGLSRPNLANDVTLYTTAGDVKISASTASTTHLIVKNSGLVGIGTTSPSYKLDVKELTTGLVAFFGYSQTSSSSNGLIKLNSGRIPQSGGDTTGESGIIFGHSGGTLGVNFDGQGGYIKSTRDSVFGITSSVNTSLVFATAAANVDTERMRITSAGNVVIGEMSSSGTFDAGSNGFYLGNSGTGGASFNFSTTNECFIFNQRDGSGVTEIDFRNGGVERGKISWTTSGTTYNTSSDYRLKTNITPLTGALVKIALLAPKTFNYIDGNGQLINGFIAHEVQEIIPEAVTGQKDEVRENGTPKYQGMDHSRIVPFLVAAMQEQQAIIESLKSRIETLEQTNP